MTFWVVGTIYVIIGIVFAIFSDIGARESLEQHPFGFIFQPLTWTQRILNGVLVLIGWPIILVKRIASLA